MILFLCNTIHNASYVEEYISLLKYDIVFLNREKQKRELLNKIY